MAASVPPMPTPAAVRAACRIVLANALPPDRERPIAAIIDEEAAAEMVQRMAAAGSATSRAKTQAARANGAKGGRPPKKKS